MALRIVFMGTPEFAVPTLRTLLDDGHDIVGVITATDKYGGRGGDKLIESAVKMFARERGLRIFQPRNLKAPEFVEELRALRAELQVVVAFRMLPVVVWNMPPMGTLNLHGSLLPKYRGAAPINWAVIRGETKTGVTTFLLKHAIDTGDILMQKSMPIGADETAGDIHDRMMYLGAEVVSKSVKGLEKGTLSPMPQPETGITKAPKIFREMCEIDFDKQAEDVHNFIRGLSPYPGAWTTIDGKTFKVYQSKMSERTDLSPGQIDASNDQLFIGCGNDSAVEALVVQMAGKRRMEVADFLNGYAISAASVGPG